MWPLLIKAWCGTVGWTWCECHKVWRCIFSFDQQPPHQRSHRQQPWQRYPTTIPSPYDVKQPPPLEERTSVTHCQLTISLANSRYITWLIVVVYIYVLYIFAHRKPWNLKYIFDTWTLKCHTKVIMSVSHLQNIFCQWNAVRIYFWWLDPEMSLSHLKNIFLCWHGLRIYFSVLQGC